METWGRGIEKICESCKKHGVPLPEYKIHLEDIMVKFIRKVSDSEQTKRAVLRKTGTTLNVILSNCTRPRTGQSACVWRKYLFRMAKMLRF